MHYHIFLKVAALEFLQSYYCSNVHKLSLKGMGKDDLTPFQKQKQKQKQNNNNNNNIKNTTRREQCE